MLETLACEASSYVYLKTPGGKFYWLNFALFWVYHRKNENKKIKPAKVYASERS